MWDKWVNHDYFNFWPSLTWSRSDYGAWTWFKFSIPMFTGSDACSWYDPERSRALWLDDDPGTPCRCRDQRCSSSSVLRRHCLEIKYAWWCKVIQHHWVPPILSSSDVFFHVFRNPHRSEITWILLLFVYTLLLFGTWMFKRRRTTERHHWFYIPSETVREMAPHNSSVSLRMLGTRSAEVVYIVLYKCYPHKR